MFPETDIETEQGTEAEETGEERTVWLWRFEQLVQSGYPELYASMLASDRAVDLDLARRLVGEARLPAGARDPDPALTRPRPDSSRPYVRMQDLTPGHGASPSASSVTGESASASRPTMQMT